MGSEHTNGRHVQEGLGLQSDLADDALGLIREIPERLRDELTAYLAPAPSFDVLHMDAVFDLRPLGLTWPALEEALGAQPMLQNLGFPRFRGSGDLNERLDALCRRPGVIVRRPPQWAHPG